MVLIDEVDAHLHVSWQKKIGGWLKDHFPAVQFIVTSHSPYICQSADPGGLIGLAGLDEEAPPRVVGEDPHDHLVLRLAAGRYDALTPRGEATIAVFGLNREDLEKARKSAFVCMCAVLRDRSLALRTGQVSRADGLTRALCDQPFVDVLYTMLRHRHHPRAALVLDGQEVVDALADPSLHLWPQVTCEKPSP